MVCSASRRLAWLGFLCVIMGTTYCAQGGTIRDGFWERIQRLYDAQGNQPEKNPANWKENDQRDKEELILFLQLNEHPPLHEWRFYPNVLAYGVFHSPDQAREDLRDGRTDAWGNQYNQILASSMNGNILWDILISPLNNIGVPLYNPDLNNKYVICFKADVHSQFTDTFRVQNGKAFRIVARTLNILGSPGSKYENSYLDSMAGAVAAAWCQRANIFVGEHDPIERLPSTVEAGPIGGESGAVGLSAKIGLGVTPEWYKDVFRVFRVPSGHLLEPENPWEEKRGYFHWMRRMLPDPLGRPPVNTQQQAGPKSQQTLHRSYLVLPVKGTPAGTTKDPGDWVFRPDPRFPGWLVASKQGGIITGTAPIYLWKPAYSPARVAREIRHRHDKEYPGETINIVIAGDPNTERNQALRKALNEAGYDDKNIFFVSGGHLYASDGRLLEKNYVPSAHCDDPRKEAAYAALRLTRETGLPGYGVVPDFDLGAGDGNGDDDSSDGADDSSDGPDEKPPIPLGDDLLERRLNMPSPPPPPPPPPRPPVARIPAVPRITLPTYKPPVIPQIGGVMLHQVARIEGSQRAGVNLTSGQFSLVVDGKNTQLEPSTFRRFVTALWAVYYSNQDPGISIDPIAPGVDKHMVRYIGKVINSDIGRVMREADYLMKQWAVGTGRADIPGFQNPDDIAAQTGVVYVGATSRFWFVPEDMRFRRAGDLLLFENGRMVVKTEFMYNNDSMYADPANERFAQFFTEHYTDIAQKYTVYKELFEYAKMVSIAKYLKESGVPLLWFLLANKDLVLTEDSPGTVDALAKGSEYFKNITIEGGVDLATQGHYVYDAEATKAITEALSKYRLTSTMGTSLGNPDISRSISDRFSFDFAGQAYSVLPQHSLTCGKDRRGIRYQTDIAFRDAGFCLTQQVLEELEVHITRMIMARAAGQSAQLSENASEEETLRWYQIIHESALEQVKPIQECLKKLKDQKYSTEQEFAQAIDKALASYSEEADYIKPMVIKQGYYNTILELVRYFNPNQRDCGEFGEGWHLMVPYRVCPAGQAKKELNGVLLPEQMAVQNLVTGDCETLTFSTDRYSVVGYVPDKVAKSQVVGLFVMSDRSFRLADKLGNEFWFDSAGRLTDMVFSEHHHTHFEYAEGFKDPFDQAPYRVESAGQERVEFQGVSLPKTMAVVDNANNTKETLAFDPNGTIVGYVPENQAKTRFQILALLSDLSFRLLDRNGSEVAFGPDGRFAGLSPSSDNPIVKSVRVGPYKVDFGYTVGPSGSPMIASARLSKEGALKTVYAVRYEYDNEGRLCRTIPVQNQLAQNALLLTGNRNTNPINSILTDCTVDG